MHWDGAVFVSVAIRLRPLTQAAADQFPVCLVSSISPLPCRVTGVLYRVTPAAESFVKQIIKYAQFNYRKTHMEK